MPEIKNQKATRLAPSPTGYLHLGHAYAAWTAFDFAQQSDARFVLRIEDTDRTRCRPEFEKAILEDLAWLGLTWEEPVRRQSEHLPLYGGFIEKLTADGLTYPCFCTRKEISERTEHAPLGPDGPIYPGTCRDLTKNAVAQNIAAGNPFSVRLNLARALSTLAERLTFEECGEDPALPKGTTEAMPEVAGDFVIARKGSTTSYHASVVIDDHLQGITDVVRGRDLYEATHIHRLLQALWGFEAPRYHHHHLILDEKGQKFSKRDQAHALQAMKKAGQTPADLKKQIEENLAHQS